MMYGLHPHDANNSLKTPLVTGIFITKHSLKLYIGLHLLSLDLDEFTCLLKVIQCQVKIKCRKLDKVQLEASRRHASRSEH